MFITKGIFSFFGNKNRGFDVNNLPDLDSAEDVQRFLKSLQSDLKSLTFDEDFRIVVEFLVDVSEKYQVENFFRENWVQVVASNFHSPLLQGLLDISLSMSERESAVFDVLIELDQPMVQFTLLKILTNVSASNRFLSFLNEKPDRVNNLLDLLKAPADYLRNGKRHAECLLFIEKIGKGNEDFCKLLAFQGIFEVLCEILDQQDDVIGKDAIVLMRTLMCRFNQDYIREVPQILQTLARSLLGPQQNEVIELVIQACTSQNGETFTPNLVFFSKLFVKLIYLAFPPSGRQNLRLLKLLKILLKQNSSEVESLASAEHSDLLDQILTYCVEKNSEENLEVLAGLIESCAGLSENFISRVTCVPGFTEMPGERAIFNYILNKSLETASENLSQVCRTFETLLFNNEPAKQLAAHLPIDLNSQTLLSKTLALWNSLLSLNSPARIHVTRLLLIWFHDSIETCSKSADQIFGMIPEVFKSMRKTGTFESLACLLLGLLSYTTKSSELRRLVLSQVEYQDLKSKIEFLALQPEFKKIQPFPAADASVTPQLVKVYTGTVQPVIRHFVKGLTESAPKDQKDLAKLFEVHEAFSSMQYLRQNHHKESADLENLVKVLKQELQDKNSEVENLKLEVRKARIEKDQESRRMVQSFINVQEQLDLRFFELESIKRENFYLKCRNERLTEELQLFHGKKMEKTGELKIIEIKENWKIQINENQSLTKLLNRKNQDYEEALEIIGKLKTSAGLTQKSFKENGFEEKGLNFSLERCEDISVTQPVLSKQAKVSPVTKDKETQALTEATSLVFPSDPDPEAIPKMSESQIPGPEPFPDWLNSPSSDAKSFFDSLERPSSISSFFQ